MTGLVLWWDQDRGHGFVRTTKGDVFVHHAAFIDVEHVGHRWREEANPLCGQMIEFDAVPGTVGTVAANARVLP